MLDSTRSAVDDVSMRARHAPPLGAVSPPTHELGAQHDGISQARAACFDSTVGLDARTPAKCQELLVAAEKASIRTFISESRGDVSVASERGHRDLLLMVAVARRR